MKRAFSVISLCFLQGVLATAAYAGVVIYEEGEKKVEVGGRIQIQYHLTDPESGDSTDEVLFRRLRPYVSGTIHESWSGKFEIDFGKSEVAVKDAFIQYAGRDGVEVTIGNQKPPFSREFLASSKRQQLVERTFVGDHNYGAPDRALGAKIDGKASSALGWSAMLGSASIDPDVKKLDFDSPVNSDDDFNEGWLVAGRLDWNVIGNPKLDQGDFGSSHGMTLSVGAFSWSNDDDNNTYTAGGSSINAKKADVDSARGFELSSGFRGAGFSVDAEYLLIDADTVDSTFSGGIFRAGSTGLDVLAIEGGYMFNKKIELVTGYETLDADGYARKWNRASLGLNYFYAKHDIKWQLTWRMSQNVNGVNGVDEDELYFQMQYVF